jgi:predicted dehydrogenase
VRGAEYGPPHFVHGRYLQDWLLLTSDWDWRLEEAAKSGGSRAVADIGSHWADLVTYVTGDVITEVLADLGTLHSSRLRPTPNGAAVDGSRSGVEPVAVRSEDFGTVIVRFGSGTRGAFTVSQTSAGCKNGLSFQVDCAQAAFAWHQEQPDRAWVGRRDQPNLELVRDPATVSSQRAGGYLPAGHPQGWLDALCSLFTDFYAAVSARQAGREYDTGIASFADGDARVRLVEAAMRSDRERRWTRIAAARGASV